LQTRTSRIDLLKIAEEGGRIGIAKEEVGQFVEEMNKATVALGDSFTGGVGEVAEKLGKLKFLFKETKDLGVDEAYNAIGSAINELGADGVASERNIAEFATRVGSLPDALKPTIANALALGAAFEESGIEAEVSSRAYNIFLKQASTETEKFGKVMGISQAEVTKLINQDPMEFFLKFAEGMKGMDAVETSKVLDYLGINADGANKAIGAVSNNIARFRDQLSLSNKSFTEGSSLLSEYEIKNNNLAATLQKVQNKLIGAFSSVALIDGLTNIVNWIAKVIGATDDVDGSGQRWRNTILFLAKAIAVVTAALVTNVAWQKLVVLWTTRNSQATLLYNLGVKARAVAEGVSIVATQLYAATTMALTGNIKGATQAIRVMATVMKTTPWGLLISLVVAVGVAYVAFSDEVDNATLAQQNFAEINLEANKSIAAQKKEIETLTKIAQEKNLTDAVRIKALEKLNQLIPDNIGFLTLENIALKEGIDILKKYTDELYKNARAKAVQSKFDDLAKQRLEVESKSGSEFQSGVGSFMASATGQGDSYNFKNEKEISDYILKNFGDFIGKRKDKTTGATLVNKEKYDKLFNDYMKASGLAEKKGQLDSLDTQMKALEAELLQSTIDELGKSKTNTPGVAYSVPNPDGTTTDKAPKKYDDSYLEAERRAREEAYQALMQMEANKIALMEEGYAKELALEKFNSAKKIHEIQMANEAILTLQKQLDIDLAQAIKDGDTKKITSIKNQQSLLLERQKSNGNLIIQEEQLSATRVSTIQEKAANDEIKRDQEAYERAKVIRETKHNEALAALGTNAKAREALQKEFDANELIEEEKHLTALIDKFNLIVGKGKFEKFDLSLLTPEQVQQFTDEAAKIGLTLSQLIDKKNELSGKGAADGAEALGLGGQTDILGFTPDNWATLFSNFEKGKIGINEMVFAVQALTNMYQMYSQFLAANEQAQLERFTKVSDAKKNKLKRQLDSGYISQATYNKQVEKIDNDLAKKKADIDYKQAKRQRIIAAANIISSTAQALIGLWVNPGFPAAIPLTSIVAAMGALQLATVMTTPLPAKGYEKGLYPDYVNVRREQDGKQYRPRYAGKLKSGLVTQNSLMVAEGNKPEMVIDNRAWSRISPEVQNALIREIRGVKGFEQGYYKNNVMYSGSTSTTSTPSSNSDALVEMCLSVIAQNTEAMNALKEKTFEAFVDPKKMQNIKNLKDGFKEFDNLKNRAKK
jgi:tubulin-specific chaperone A